MVTDVKFLVNPLWYGFVAFGVFALIYGEINKRRAFKRNKNNRCARCNVQIYVGTIETINVAGPWTPAKVCHQCFKRDRKIWLGIYSFIFILIIFTLSFLIWTGRH